MMLCPTPHIDLPGQFVNLTLYVQDSRRRSPQQEFHLRIRRNSKEQEQIKISQHEISNEK